MKRGGHFLLRKRDIKKQVWLNETENKRLKENAKKTGLNESAYLRSLIMGYKPKEQPNEKFYEDMNQLRGISINLNQIARKANSLGLVDAPFYRKTYNKLNEFMQHIKKEYLDIEKGT
jgi:bacterial mobilization protein MobC